MTSVGRLLTAHAARNFISLSGGNGTVKRKLMMSVAVLGIVVTSAAQAGNFFNFMNPNRWFGDNDRDRYYDRGYYGYGPYGGWGGPYGGWGGPYGGWGGPWGGYGPYGYGGYGGYGGGYPSTIVVSPSSEGNKSAAPRPE
jgi:hypothetical protein